MKRLMKQAEKEAENEFFHNPLAYLEAIPGLKQRNDDYRFFVVSLNGNLYTEKYVDELNKFFIN